MGADCPIPGTPIFLRGIFISTCHRRPLWYFAAKQSETNVVWLVTDLFPSSPRRDGYLSQVTPPPPRRLTSKWYSLATILKISSKSCNFARKAFCHWMNIGSCPGGFLVPPPFLLKQHHMNLFSLGGLFFHYTPRDIPKRSVLFCL